MQSSLRVVVSLLASAAIVTLAVSAEATSVAPGPSCNARVLPSALTAVPSNAPALLFVDESVDAVATVTGTLAATGGDVTALPRPTTDPLGTPVVQLPSALVAGRTYDLQVAVNCSVPAAGSLPRASRFVGGEATALPTFVGSLRSSGRTDAPTIDLEPSPALSAYLPLSIVTLTVNGAVQQRLVGPTDPKQLSFDAQTGDACRDSATGELHGGVGTADVTVTAHVAGTTSDPQAATTRVSVDCDDLVARVASGSQPEGDSGGGCSASRARASAAGMGTWVLVGLALAALAALRRRSPRARHARAWTTFALGTALVTTAVAACSSSPDPAVVPGDAGNDGDADAAAEDSGACCEPDPAPGCCMSYGGWSEHACGRACDGMPESDDPGWKLTTDTHGCRVWTNPNDAWNGGTRNPATAYCGGVRVDSGLDDASDASDGADGADASDGADQ